MFTHTVRHEPHLTYQECLERYPRLAKALGWCLIASPSEAGCCIRDYRDGFDFGGEVVSHAGGTPKSAIEWAISSRHAARRLNGGRLDGRTPAVA